jgi:hypothetical protein
MSRVRGEIRSIAELGVDEKRGDLLAYNVSQKHAAVRALLGVDARSSVAPPAGPSAEPSESAPSAPSVAALGPAA